MKLLMHACCAPCSVYCVDTLRKEKIEPTMFWYNPNIHPYNEYKARLDCFKEYCKIMNLKSIIIDEYGLDEFCKSTANDLENRCTNYCYPKRLSKLFEYAKKNGYDVVSTTLLYSIYQKHDFIKNFCQKLSISTGIKFLYKDFRVGYWEGHEKAIELGLYMQKYCGCIFSLEDAEYYHKKTTPSLPNGFDKIKRTSLEVKKISDKQEIQKFLNEKDCGKPLQIESLQVSDFDIFGLQKDGKTVSLIVISKKCNDGKDENFKIINEKDINYNKANHISNESMILNNNTNINHIPISLSRNIKKINSNIEEAVEVKELITLKEYRNKGFGTKLLKSMQGNYKQKYKKMVIGATGDYIPFFVKNGFTNFIKQEGNILYYSKELQDK